MDFILKLRPFRGEAKENGLKRQQATFGGGIRSIIGPTGSEGR